jgi:hypothetical protein
MMMSLFYTGSFKQVSITLAAHHVVSALLQLQGRLHQLCLKKETSTTIKSLKTHLQSHILQTLTQLQALVKSATDEEGTTDALLLPLQNIQQESKRLARLMQALDPQAPRMEMLHLLNAVLPLSFLNDMDSRVFLMDSPSAALDWPLPTVLVERLPSVYHTLPTQWMVASYAFLNTWAEQLQPALEGEKQTSVSTWKIAMTAHVLGIRVWGAAYYMEWIVAHLVNRDYLALAKVEPLLLDALHFFGTTTPQVLRLHSVVEALSQDVSSLSKRMRDDVEDVDFKSILRMVDHQVSRTDSFSERHTAEALLLQARLKEGLPVSAIQHNDLNEVWTKLQALGLTEESTETPDYEALHEQGAIYQLIAQVRETPVGAKEMMLAAWMHRLEDAFSTLDGIMQVAPDDFSDWWDAFWPSQDAFQQRFMKSIETADVHHVLLGQPRRHCRKSSTPSNRHSTNAQASVALKPFSFV